MRFLLTILSCIALASAAVLPRADATSGHLTYGDVKLDLKVGCQDVPQNKDDGLPIATIFTNLKVEQGYTCELYHSRKCENKSIMVTKGPYAYAEYVFPAVYSAKCSKN